ncbi:hypothetical protein Athai_25190 [Actinocatenispora thailandica]|uniref:CD225/dispanin family protein n=1 Tax=Actinocatenispora thailandica TaxID=227318 RepID=A0A7R7HWP9_9ACTN|nr:CD225/dispanin family protein [Actinocatenispora thailandica]BCJ35016.1 hypothetical protein Athai_25190 [Actinocatenispora thailandica]
MPSEYDYVREPSGSTPGTWLGLSIASTVCCCTPFGIVGIVFSAMAMSARDRNDMDEMERQLSRARGWTIAAIVCGVVGGIVLFALRASSDFS